MLAAKKSCDEIILRVKRDSLFNSLIASLSASLHAVFDERINEQRLITELTTEPHSRTSRQLSSSCTDAPRWARLCAQTSRSDSQCLASSLDQVSFSSFLTSSDHLRAGRAPAFSFGACLRQLRGARRAGFISVSGQCAARSAHFSDLRNHKRSSGGVAATEHLRAPMNSPIGAAFTAVAERVFFLTSAHTSASKEFSPWQ